MTRITPNEVIELAEIYLRGEKPFGGAKPWQTAPGKEHPLFTGGAC